MIAAGRVTAMSIFVLIIVVIMICYYLATKGRKFVIRKKIAGFEAIPQAVGRATEMGGVMHGVTGGSPTSGARGPHVVAGLAILGYIAELGAKNKVPLYISVRDPDQIVLSEDTLRVAYAKAGCPEDFRREYALYHGERDATYAAGILGFLAREKVAVNFMIGGFGSEAIIISEGASRLGCYQIGGTPTIFTTPFLIPTCEFVIMGDELFAAACIVSGDPKETSIMIAEDVVKFALICLAIVGSVLATFGSTWMINILKM
jgi:hypothetical protein